MFAEAQFAVVHPRARPRRQVDADLLFDEFMRPPACLVRRARKVRCRLDVQIEHHIQLAPVYGDSGDRAPHVRRLARFLLDPRGDLFGRDDGVAGLDITHAHLL